MLVALGEGFLTLYHILLGHAAVLSQPGGSYLEDRANSERMAKYSFKM